MADENLLSTKEMNTFEELLDIIVSADGSWSDKKEKLVAQLSETGHIHLQELTGWFEGE